jgi:hypothetical protein
VDLCDGVRKPNNLNECIDPTAPDNEFKFLVDGKLFDKCPSRFYNFADNSCVTSCQASDYKLESSIGTACSPTNAMCKFYTPDKECVDVCAAPYPFK